jgi:DNA-binding beta-propeller fold protein YncE
VLVAAGRSATARAAPFAYAMVRGADQVAEFGAAAGPLTAVGRVGSGRGSFSVAVTPDGTNVYVANPGVLALC